MNIEPTTPGTPRNHLHLSPWLAAAGFVAAAALAGEPRGPAGPPPPPAPAAAHPCPAWGGPGGMPGGWWGAPPHAPLQKAAYLGVSLTVPPAALRSQLALPPGTGVVVSYIAPDGPAGKVLKPFDILTRLDDQILVNPEQVAVLIRLHKPGDRITLEIVRNGERKPVKIVLGEKALPPLETLFQASRMIPVPVPPLPGMVPPAPKNGAMANPPPFAPGPPRGRGTPFRPGRPAPPSGPGRKLAPPAPPMGAGAGWNPQTRAAASASGVYTVTRNGKTLILTTDPVHGERLLCVRPDGTIAFNGVLDRPEARRGVPADFRELLRQAEQNRQRLPRAPAGPPNPAGPNL